MSENEGGESRSVGAFLLGFLTGVLVCLGAGGAFFVVAGRQATMRMQEAMMRAEEARADAEMQRKVAEEERARALKAMSDAEAARRKAEAAAKTK
jgi:hypothetical protein